MDNNNLIKLSHVQSNNNNNNSCDRLLYSPPKISLSTANLRSKARDLCKREALLKERQALVTADDAYWLQKKHDVKARETHIRAETDRYLAQIELLTAEIDVLQSKRVAVEAAKVQARDKLASNKGKGKEIRDAEARIEAERREMERCLERQAEEVRVRQAAIEEVRGRINREELR